MTDLQENSSAASRFKGKQDRPSGFLTSGKAGS